MTKLKFRTLTTFVLTVIMIISVSSNPVTAKGNTKSADLKLTDNTTAAVEILGEKVKGTYSVEYDFTILEAEEDSVFSITLNGTIINGKKTYPFNASGDINSITLTDGRVLLEGPIDGTILVKKEKFPLTVGVRSIKGEPEASFGLTIYPGEKGKVFKDIALVYFGDFIKTQDLIDELNPESASDINEISQTKSSLMVPLSSGNYVYEGYDYASFKTSSLSTQTGNSQKIKTYMDTYAKKIRVDLTSYCYKFGDSDFPSIPSGEFIEAGVYEFSVGLKPYSGTGYIDGIEDPGGDLASYNGTKSLLEDVFLDVLGAFNIPAWTVAAIFEQARGYINVTSYSNNAHVDVRVEAGKIIDLDGGNFGIAFQLDNNTTDDTIFYANSEMKYVIDCLWCAFYVDTYDTSESVDMPF